MKLAATPEPEKRSKRTEYFEVYSKPDGFGRQHFAILWWDTSWKKWRGQHFRSQLDDYTTKTKARGRKVAIVEMIES